MFLEPYAQIVGQQNPTGSIEVICGPMFSGKTKALIARLRQAADIGYRVQIFKPAIDTRYQIGFLVSHDQDSLACNSVTNAGDILEKLDDCQVIGIDEAQFFGAELLSVCNKMANSGIRVIVSGLDMDFRGQPFDPMPALLAGADVIVKLQSVCSSCSAPAIYSFRKAIDQEQMLLGEKESYEARCRNCFKGA